jgi:hypothetical protein
MFKRNGLRCAVYAKPCGKGFYAPTAAVSRRFASDPQKVIALIPQEINGKIAVKTFGKIQETLKNRRYS